MTTQTSMFPAKQDYSAATLRLEGIPAIYYQFTGRVVAIQAGDFIRARRLPVVCGFVTEHVELHLGRKATMRGYRVRLASGRIDFIPEEDAEFIG